MVNSINLSSIYVLDQNEALDFYVGKLGLEVRNDFDLGVMRWLTVGVPGETREILLELPGPHAMDEATAERVRENISKGVGGGWIGFHTDDCQADYERLEAAGVEITQEPVTHFYGTDVGIRDPFGNHLRIVQPAAVPGEPVMPAAP